MPVDTIKRPLNATSIVLTSFLCLILSHFSINTYAPSLAINALSIGLIMLILFRVLFSKRDLFGFLLIIFFCAQFQVGNNQGGLFNLLAFAMLSGYFILRSSRQLPGWPDRTITTLVATLFVFNTLGLVVRGPSPMHIKVLEFSAFTGFLMAFYAASELRMTDKRVRALVYVIGWMVIYDLLVSLNQHYSILKIATPLLGLTERLFYAATNAFGTFGSATMNATFNVMMLVFLIPLFCASVAKERLRLNSIFLGLVCLMNCLLVVLANSRSAAVAVAIAIPVYMIIFSSFYQRSFRYAKYVNRVAIAGLIFLAFFGTRVGLQNLSEDFATVKINDTGSVLSGEALNRGGHWVAGLENLRDRSWILGFGHGVIASNNLAWRAARRGGDPHLHNLYLALPTLYGWTGAAAYVAILLTVVSRLYRTVRRYSFSTLSVVLALGFLMSIAFFVLDEIKSGNAVQYVNQPMIFFIWLGFGLATVRTVREDISDESLARTPQPTADQHTAPPRIATHPV